MQPENQVVTGEAVALDLQLAGAGSRGVAAILDLLVMAFASLLVFFFVALVGFGNVDQVLTSVIVVEVLVVVGYPVAMETLWRGRTLGKAAMGLRVVRDDGGPIRFRHAFVRGIVGFVVDKPGITYGLGAFIPMVWSVRKKRLGDFAAGTMVLQERVPGKLEAVITMPPALAHWAYGLDLTGIDDSLALQIRHFIARSSQLAPDARNNLEYQLTSQVVARVGQPPAGAPGWAILSAVLAERRRRAFESTQPAQPQWPTHQPTYAPPAAPVATSSSNQAETGTGFPPPPVTPPTSGFAPPS